ncbi:MAG: tryptophan synthase subunit alpha [Spirochaetaceae bacterium]
MSTASLMAHLVAYYPSKTESLEVARELVRGGASFLEVQFPFSDPTADGPTIQKASAAALEAGFRIEGGFELVATVAAEHTPEHSSERTATPPVFIMTYASLVVAYGVERFAERAARAGAAGLIVPDLPPDYDEGLYAAGSAAGLHVVPVLVPTASPERVARALGTEPAYVYAALRAGTTGEATELGEENLSFLRRLREGGVHVIAGFGIRDRRQVEALMEHADTVVVGSAFVDAVARGMSVRALAENLVYGRGF